jgi:hypothetical protein
MPPLLYRSASGTAASMTPRPGKDTEGPKRGLSFFETIGRVPGRGAIKVLVVDAAKIGAPLGTEDHGDGHLSLVPHTTDGSIDDDALREWAQARGGAATHPLTQKVLDAVVQVLQKGEA